MILWAHGLEGSPEGTKVRALRAAGLVVQAPDGRGQPLAQRLLTLEALSAELAEQRPLLAGSSYGGLAAAWLAQQHPQRFRGLLLCAPALHHVEDPVRAVEQLVAPVGLPVHILHGRLDSVVPLQASRDYATRSGGRPVLQVLEDDHRLAGSLEQIVAAARALLAQP